MFKISRVAHAGYVIETKSTKVIFDPVIINPFSTNAYVYPDIIFDYEQFKKQKFDAIFISHYHDDHLCLKSLSYFDKNTPVYLFSIHAVFFDLLKQIGFKNVYSLQHNSLVDINNELSITPLRALDADIDCLFHIQFEDINILNVVDSWIDVDVLSNLKNTLWDVILWPFQTMREIEVLAPSCFEPSDQKVPVEHLQQIKTLKPRYIIPSSCQFKFEEWSWYNHHFFPISYDSFSKQIHDIEPDVHVIKINPGDTFTFQDCDLIPSSKSLNWIASKQKNDVEYTYDHTLPPQSLAFISKQFPSLTDIQKQKIEKFLVEDLINQLTSIGSEYEKSVIWCFKIYDQSGDAESYFYDIDQSGYMKIRNEQSGHFDWLTEISYFKLFSAVYCGEALTSLYLRITPDHRFLKQTDMDILNDPFVVWLSHQDIAGYHKNQLTEKPLY